MIKDYEDFKDAVLKLSTIDLNAYKERQMKRRIDSLIRKNNAKDYEEFVHILKTDQAIYEEFINYLTINVSEFYRNPAQWKVLEEEIIPYLLEKFSGRNLKIWSAACSTGDEPYSLAMLLGKFMPLSQVNIIATDIDKQVLEAAKTGLYREKSLSGLPEDFKRKYFKQNGASFQITDTIKKCITFKQMNLLKDAYPTGCDLIVCRNVLIYFTDDAKHQIYRKFNGALKKDGILFVGSTEQIIGSGQYKLTSLRSFFYRKDDDLL
ncbi:protein-glutamate O-methyltransferase CheR [Vallitalea pronyensis]|uniref:protein-glutamate O-methyltransferase n=1 Tax=Vallitalea pronyensis TaxID=1348613 RepID=A0A8J8MKF0_9FIRM|nr:protein-glutamate O-methyltransferase CheR [Vallitalea pronyensis]QUI23101.1 protein-glutamate O-methyltransferase CheR [Vallitalea pronyensis]